MLACWAEFLSVHGALSVSSFILFFLIFKKAFLSCGFYYLFLYGSAL